MDFRQAFSSLPYHTKSYILGRSSKTISLLRSMKMRCLLVCALLGLLGAGCWAASVAELLTGAKAETVVKLPAGIFTVNALVIPPGVSVRGAGYGQTILDAAGARNGVIVTGNSGVTLSDLTIRSARETGLILRQSKDVTVRNVKPAAT